MQLATFHHLALFAIQPGFDFFQMWQALLLPRLQPLGIAGIGQLLFDPVQRADQVHGFIGQQFFTFGWLLLKHYWACCSVSC